MQRGGIGVGIASSSLLPDRELAPIDLDRRVAPARLPEGNEDEEEIMQK